MASEWYYTVNGQQAPTPVSASQLRQLAANGQLQPTDLVWQEGMANWVPASSIKGLFSSKGSSGEQAPLVEVPETPTKSRSRSKRRREEEEEEEVEVTSSSGSGLLGLHPLLVWLLSVCTCNLFGLVYAYLVCSNYGEQISQREADTSGRPLGTPRHPLGVALLSYLTFGFYNLYWIYKVMGECAAYTGRKDINARVELALMLIFPFYAVYLAVFRLPEMIRAAQQQAKLSELSGGQAYVFLLPCMYPALPFLSMTQQDALNDLWFRAP
jgi:hypothetical protein